MAKRLGLDGEWCLDSFSITQCHLHRCLKGDTLSWNGVADGARHFLPVGKRIRRPYRMAPEEYESKQGKGELATRHLRKDDLAPIIIQRK